MADRQVYGASSELEAVFRLEFPLRVRILRNNLHGIPIGKTFPFAKKQGADGSPIQVYVKSMWPSAYSLQLYEFNENEVEIID